MFFFGGGGGKGSTFPTNRKNFPDNNILKLSPPPVENFFGEKMFPDNNITIAFIAFFPLLVALFSILQH
jgi:hypothetical protein